MSRTSKFLQATEGVQSRGGIMGFNDDDDDMDREDGFDDSDLIKKGGAKKGGAKPPPPKGKQKAQQIDLFKGPASGGVMKKGGGDPKK